jgi:hypothetical protein
VDPYYTCKNAQEMLVAGGGTLLCIVFLLVSSSPQLAESAAGPLDELTRAVGPAEQNGQGKQTSHSGSTFERILDLWNTLRDGFVYRLETRVHTKIFFKYTYIKRHIHITCSHCCAIFAKSLRKETHCHPYLQLEASRGQILSFADRKILIPKL